MEGEKKVHAATEPLYILRSVKHFVESTSTPSRISSREVFPSFFIFYKFIYFFILIKVRVIGGINVKDFEDSLQMFRVEIWGSAPHDR